MYRIYSCTQDEAETRHGKGRLWNGRPGESPTAWTAGSVAGVSSSSSSGRMERLAASGSAAIVSTGALRCCIRATCPTGRTCNCRQRRLSRFVMGKGLKVPRTCADQHDVGPNWAHECQVLHAAGASDITNDDNHELPAAHIIWPLCTRKGRAA